MFHKQCRPVWGGGGVFHANSIWGRQHGPEPRVPVSPCLNPPSPPSSSEVWREPPEKGPPAWDIIASQLMDIFPHLMLICYS